MRAKRGNLAVAAASVSLAVFLAILFTPPKPAYACMCGSSGSPRDAMAEADAVFLGKVVAIHAPGPSMRDGQLVISSADLLKVEFSVSQVWKGPRREAMTVETERMGVSCGYEFKEGRRYIVYTWGGSRTGLCTRTAPVWLAVRDFAALGLGERPESTTEDKAIPSPVVESADERKPRGGSCGKSAATAGEPTEFAPLALLVGIVWVGARGWRRK